MRPNHVTLPLQKGIIYGPVNSRRLGASLGVNLLSVDRKICSFNCVYCQYGQAYPLRSGEKVSWLPGLPTADEVAKALVAALKDSADLAYITFSGNGEATLHPDFPEIVTRVVAARDRLSPRARTAILSNATELERPEIAAAVRCLDVPILKLDAGDPDLFLRINRPEPRTTLDKILGNLTTFEHPQLTIQTLFFGGSPSNADTQAIAKWAELLNRIHPYEVQIYTLSRPSATLGLIPLTRARLLQIATYAQDIAHVPVNVY